MPYTNKIAADCLAPVGVLEDDPAQITWVSELLSSAGYKSKTYSDGSALLADLKSQTKFALLLLDWELPGINGMEVLKWARTNCDPSLPIIFITNRTHETDLVDGLNAGADDYITKPCRPAELLARINAQLRRNQPSATPESNFNFGNYQIDVSVRQISLAGKSVVLTPKEYDLAVLFLRHPGRLFSRDDLSFLVWNRDIPSTSRTLDTHLSNIRKKLNLGPANGVQLSASYALGYRLDLYQPDEQPTY